MLKGKKVLVTGGSRGIGKAIALKMAQEGADVVIFATKRSESVDEVINEIKALGRRAEFIECNVADSKEVNSAVKLAVEFLGGLDVLVNNAGIIKDKLLIQMTDDDFTQVIDVNLKGCFNMAKAVIRCFIKQKQGRIINISSVVGMMGNSGQVNYAASKAGILGLTKSIAKEYASKGITCNAVAPGYINTDMTNEMTEIASQAILAQIPVKRYGTPEDVANTVSFLAQDETSYITGEIIKIDGGMYI